MLITIIEALLVAMILLGIIFEKRLVAWEEEHIPKVRSFFIGIGYGILELTDKALDGAAWLIAQPIRFARKRGIRR